MKALFKSMALGLSLFLIGSAPPPPDYDLVIRGGRVLDGGGNPWVAADVAVKDGWIVRIGTVTGTAALEIDARGRYVAPGFIDMMDQSGAALLRGDMAENKLRMGVTTLIAGEAGTPVPAAEIPDFFARLERQGLPVNFGTYYSAGQARVHVMGDAAGVPTAPQMQAMKAEVRAAMRAGAFGISSALIYPPHSYNSTDDLATLAAIPGACGGFYATHMRDESDKLLTAIQEAIAIGEQSGAKVEIFHIKAAYAPGWGKLMPEALKLIEEARARGVDVAADIYPYTAGGTGLEVTVPSRLFAEGKEEAWAQLRDPVVRAQLKREVEAGPQPSWSNLVSAAGGWQNIVLADSHNSQYTRFHGKNFVEIGQALEQDPADAAWDILLAALPNRATALFFLMDEQDIEAAMRRPWVSIGSDAGAVTMTGQVDRNDLPHPRSFGTFPRVLEEYARVRNVLTLEDAIRKMTSWPSHRMGLADRGVLREGLRADMVIFDYAELDDGATWEAPRSLPTGIEHVIVNGTVSLTDGKLTGLRGGHVLRHRCEN